jgi:COP9 signalosome complex subunit 2
MKLARLYLSQRDWRALRALLSSVEETLSTAGASAAAASSGAAEADAERGKSTQLLEVAALQISMYSELRDGKRLGEAYRRAQAVSRSAVPHPSISGTLHEAGGKLRMGERDWEGARVEFLEAFKAYEEAGLADRTLACLRYMLLANMLSASRINPFDSQETKAYERDPSITALTALTEANLKNDIAAFEPVLRSVAAASDASSSVGAGTSAAKALTAVGGAGPALVFDEFMAPYVGDLLATIRSKVLLSLVGPYTRISLASLAAELFMAPQEAEELCVMLILDGKLVASIDQVAQVLLLKPQPPAAAGPVAGGPSSAHSKTGVSAKAATSAGRYGTVAQLATKLGELVASVPTLATAPSAHMQAERGGGSAYETSFSGAQHVVVTANLSNLRPLWIICCGAAVRSWQLVGAPPSNYLARTGRASSS